MNPLQRTVTAVTKMYKDYIEATSVASFERKLDDRIKSGAFDDYLVEKATNQTLDRYKTTKSKLESRQYSGFFSSFFSHLYTTIRENDVPPIGDPSRDWKLSCFWQNEPLLAGAIYSMSAKMTSLSWSMTGKKESALYFSNILRTAAHMGGYDWGAFISASAQDFYSCDRGVFWETPRDSSGRLAELGHIDSLQCALTGIYNKPVYYYSDLTGQEIWFKPDEIVHFTSLPSPRDRHLGSGFCAVSRSYRAAKLLMGLHQYDEEKLSNLPPEGVAPVTGLTQEEFMDALEMWKIERKKNNSLTFPQVLWLLASQPGAQVDVKMVGFSQLPESFDRARVVDQYVNTLALTFGVDAREFWPITSSSLGTASESEIQHMKAKGKGPAEFLSTIERKINAEFSDADQVDFQFDTQDMGEDQTAATVAKTWVDAFMPLYTGAGNSAGGKPGGGDKGLTTEGEVPANQTAMNPQMKGGQSDPLISKDQFLRLLVDRGVLPNWIVEDERVAVYDSGLEEKHFQSMKTIYRIGNELKEYYDTSDVVKIVWKDGILKQTRLDPIKVIPAKGQENVVPYAELLDYLSAKELQVVERTRNIRGRPIPPSEAERGAKPTKQAVLDELQRWRTSPILSKYLPETLSENSVLATLESKS